MSFKEMISNALDEIPVMGHVKGCVHHALGDTESGNKALNTATRSTVILAAAATTGGVGALPAAMLYDSAATLITEKPQGYVAKTQNFIEDPSLSTALDLTLTAAEDVAGGYSAAKGLKDIPLRQVKRKDALVGALKITHKVCKRGEVHLINETVKNVFKIGPNRSQSRILYLENSSGKKDSRGTKCSHESSEESSDEEDRYKPRYGYEFNKESSDEEDTDEENDFDDAYAYDDYEVDAYPPLTQAQKEAILQGKKYQTPKGHLPRNIRGQNVPISRKDELDDTKEKFERLDPDERSNANDENLWRRPTWLYVRTPSSFNYTGAVVTNMLQQGLLHIVIRHGNQIANFIPGFETIFNRLPEQIQYIIRQLQSAREQPLCEILTARLEQALRDLDPETAEDTEKILYELQMKLYEYLQRNIVSSEYNRGYSGDGCNNRARQTVFFKVQNREGHTEVMVVCVSDQLYRNPGCFGNDRRPVRTIITCYFISLDEYIERLVKELF